MRNLNVMEIDMVYGGSGCEYGNYGNNGWGNGEDPTNPGSFSGGTAASKSSNSSVPPGRINTNPTESDGR